MRLRPAPLLAALALLAVRAPAQAQAAPCHVLCAPRFVAQPGVIVRNAVNPPATPGGGHAASTTDFLLRMATVVPTELPRTSLSFALQWTPFADRNGFTANAPGFTYGPVFSIANLGPVSTAFDVLGAYGPSSTGTAAYRNELVLKLDATLAFGRVLGAAASPYVSRAGLYAFVAQQMTGLPRDAEGDRVHAPTLMFGVTLPVAPLP